MTSRQFCSFPRLKRCQDLKQKAPRHWERSRRYTTPRMSSGTSSHLTEILECQRRRERCSLHFGELAEASLQHVWQVLDASIHLGSADHFLSIPVCSTAHQEQPSTLSQALDLGLNFSGREVNWTFASSLLCNSCHCEPNIVKQKKSYLAPPSRRNCGQYHRQFVWVSLSAQPLETLKLLVMMQVQCQAG